MVVITVMREVFALVRRQVFCRKSDESPMGKDGCTSSEVEHGVILGGGDPVRRGLNFELQDYRRIPIPWERHWRGPGEDHREWGIGQGIDVLVRDAEGDEGSEIHGNIHLVGVLVNDRFGRRAVSDVYLLPAQVNQFRTIHESTL